MKLVVTSDWHVDHVTNGVSRFAEIERAAQESVSTAIEQKADAYVFLGDLCDPDAGSAVFRCIRTAIAVASRLWASKIPSIWLAGNHDVIEDGTGETTLSPLRHVDGACVAESSTQVRFAGVAFACLPFTAATSPRPGLDPESFLKGWNHSKDASIVLSHLTVPGVVPGEETTELPRGREVLLPEALAHEKACLVLQGHYHRRQRTALGTQIPGSLARLTFGEQSHFPSYLVAEV